MSDAGWIPWDGSAGLPRSIDRYDIVDMRFRDGNEGHNRRAGEWDWRHFDAPSDIIAYRLSRAAPEMKVAAQAKLETEPQADRIAALEAENARMREALTDARKVMRNAWGAVTSNQVHDKEFDKMLWRGKEAIDAALTQKENEG